MAITKKSNEFDHAPGAELDYGLNYENWLNSGETIVDSQWEVTGDLTLSSQQISGATTSVFVAGGERGVVYYLTNSITTSSTPPRKDSRTVVISCKKL